MLNCPSFYEPKLKKNSKTSSLQTLIKWLLALVIFASSSGWMVWKKEYTVSVRYGETRHSTLSDGLSVTLSGGSSVRVPFYFRALRRQVWLKGEAFLDIAPAEKPWHIETFNADIRVRDGRLNIRAWPDDYRPETAVTLANGDVTIGKKGSEIIVLPPGFAMRVVNREKSSAEPVPMPFERAIAWLAGGLYFEDRPLVDVLKALERRYAVRLSVASEDLKGLTTTYVNPQPVSLDEVLDDLSYSLDLHHHESLNGFEFSRF